MTDLNDCKVPIFINVNSTPREPTAEQAGNGSDLILRYNSLIEYVAILENRINSLELAKQHRLSYQSNGDAYGLFYYLGSDKYRQAWVNPCPQKVAITLRTPNQVSGPSSNLIDRSDSQVLVEPVNGSAEIIFDLGPYRQFVCERYSVRHRTDYSDSHMRTWKLQGSNNEIDWNDLDVRVDDTTITNSGQWYSPICNNPSDVPYRYFRMICTDGTSGPRLFVSECEFYGVYHELQ